MSRGSEYGRPHPAVSNWIIPARGGCARFFAEVYRRDQCAAPGIDLVSSRNIIMCGPSGGHHRR